MAIPYESDIPMHGWYPYSDIHRERVRAHAKHDDNGESMERRPWHSEAWLPVIVEELGEASQVLNDHRHGDGNYSDKKALIQHLREELVQVAAMTVAWIEQCQ